jgi:type IX secretion system PorP/SprF family membrane protein
MIPHLHTFFFGSFRGLKTSVVLYAFFYIFTVPFLNAQDAVFSQYYASSLYLNPALAGLQPDISLSTNYRIQWNSISPYKTGQVSMIYPLLNKNKPTHEHWGGTGISIFQDLAGTNGGFQTLGANVNFAYNLPLSSEKHQIISFGLQGGFIQQKIDPGNYEWGTKYTTGNNGIDPSVADQSSILNTTKLYPDLSAGVIWYLNNSKNDAERKFSSFAGFSLYHINSPDQSLIQGKSIHLPRLFKFHGGIKLHLSKKVNVSPNFIVALQNRQYQYNPGIYLSYRIIEPGTGLLTSTDLILGGWYRVKDAFIISTGLSSRFLTIGLSYDLNNSGLRSYTKGRGAYEVSLSFRIPRSLKLLRYDTPRI